MNKINQFLGYVFCLFFLVPSFESVLSRESGDSTEIIPHSVYKPRAILLREQDSTPINDTVTAEEIEMNDSIMIRLQYVKDSIAARELFVQDSILAREKFVRDSLLRRKQILDSVTFLINVLPPLLEASIHTHHDDFILRTNEINIVGDSMLSDFNYVRLPFKFNEPYIPWKKTINLSTKPPQFDIDLKRNLINSIQAPGINNRFKPSSDRRIIVIQRQGMFASKHGNKFYKAPIDSVFFNNSGGVIKVKRYYLMFAATDNFQKGSFLFTFLWQVKQYKYASGALSSYEVVKFCDRWSASAPSKVCNKATYSITKVGYSYTLIRANDPVNVYSDGKYTFEFDNLDNLKSVAFLNNKQTENWKTFIELNEKGFVSRYVYQNGGIVNRTLLVNYYLDDPKAKNKVETVTCTFEDDGISYYQYNNTTEESRARDRLTGEWSPWTRSK